jgi:hypothetical protein
MKKALIIAAALFVVMGIMATAASVADAFMAIAGRL